MVYIYDGMRKDSKLAVVASDIIRLLRLAAIASDYE